MGMSAEGGAVDRTKAAKRLNGTALVRAMHDLRGRVAGQIEELASVMMHLREAHECYATNPEGAAMSLGDAGAELMAMHDAFGALSKGAFDLKGALS